LVNLSLDENATRMELHHFRYFVAVAEELSFTNAAKRLGMAQPPLSYQIRSLENEIGVQLFERRSRRVFLTDAGCRFLDGARLVLQEAEAAVDVARQAKSGALGTVRVGFGKGLGDVVSTVINQHLRLFPGIEVDVRDVFSGFQVEALKTRKIDVGFSHGHPASLNLVSEKLFNEGLTIVVPRSSPLAKRRRLAMSDLAEQTIMLIDRSISPSVYDKVLELSRDAGLNPRTLSTETTPYDEAGAMMVASGRGIYFAVGRSPIHPAFADRLVAIPLHDALESIEVSIAWRKGESSPAILNFIESARKQLQRVSSVRNLRHSLRNGAQSSRTSRNRGRQSFAWSR
jgi:DNA-binding transcriptional LysR family regulator